MYAAEKQLFLYSKGKLDVLYTLLSNVFGLQDTHVYITCIYKKIYKIYYKCICNFVVLLHCYLHRQQLFVILNIAL